MQHVDDFNWDDFFDDKRDAFRKYVSQIIKRYQQALELAEANRQLSTQTEFKDPEAQDVICFWVHEHETAAARCKDILDRLGVDPSK